MDGDDDTVRMIENNLFFDRLFDFKLDLQRIVAVGIVADDEMSCALVSKELDVTLCLSTQLPASTETLALYGKPRCAADSFYKRHQGFRIGTILGENGEHRHDSIHGSKNSESEPSFFRNRLA